MPRIPRPSLDAAALRGFRLLRPLADLLPGLHADAAARDRAGNRRLFYDHYLALLLLYFFSPALTSLRALQQASTLAAVGRRLGVPRTSLGALSEAARLFDPAALRAVLRELAARVPPPPGPATREAAALRDLTAVDGSLMPALPRMAWALWNAPGRRAAKLHLHFDVLRGVPVEAALTPAACGEPARLRADLRPGRLYVTDRGYADYALIGAVVRAGSSVVARLRDDAAYRVAEERPIGPAAAAAGVTRDAALAKLGSDHHRDGAGVPLRVVVAERPDGSRWVLATDRLELDAELVVLAYRYRWSVELFFRWLKCVVGCRHWLSTDRGGMTIQVYAALIACLLIALRAGRRATRRTFEMACLYLSGWASERELLAHVAALDAHPP